MKFKMNDVCYIERNGIVAKCRIEEIIEHHTQNGDILKYIVHAYGIKEPLTMNEEDLVENLYEATERAEKMIQNVYIDSMANLKNATDEIFEKKEKELIG